MALTFEIKLSFQCVQMLFGLVAWNDYRIETGQDFDARTDKNMPAGKTGLDKWHQMLGAGNYPHFVTHARILKENGLIVDRSSWWEVTEKGRLMARVLEIEFSEAKKNVAALGQRSMRRLKTA